MERLLGKLMDTGQRFLMQTYSSLDRYYRNKNGRTYFFLTQAPLHLIAARFDDIEYRGTSESDVMVNEEGVRAFIQCVDELDRPPDRPFTVQRLYYDFEADRFLDPAGVYPDLRARVLRPVRPLAHSSACVRDAALLVAHYNLSCPDGLFGPEPLEHELGVYEQRRLLETLLSSGRPERGLLLLRDSGFIQRHWPELESMAEVKQTKDHHPEGDVFDHVLEAFRYRKQNDLILSLAILLHDLGKTVAERTRERPYHDHADRGALLARRFLRRLEFPDGLIEQVVFLVRHHMMPEALPRMPLYRIEKLLASPLFPTLLELYRADLLSTYRRPEPYYEACRVYGAYRKKIGNPFKSLPMQKPINLSSTRRSPR